MTNNTRFSVCKYSESPYSLSHASITAHFSCESAHSSHTATCLSALNNYCNLIKNSNSLRCKIVKSSVKTIYCTALYIKHTALYV